MPDNLYEGLATQLKAMEPIIEDLKDKIAALREAGESTVEVEKKYNALLNRTNKWRAMLKRRGYM